MDYLEVDPSLGGWDDITAIGQDFRLMFDAAVNHVSASSRWFRAFLEDEPPYRDYFITVDPETDLSSVVRPRSSPLLTPFQTASGTKYVWTTFSADQCDLNYHNPEVLLEIVRVLLTYLAKGASILRLDAAAYLWKEVGTSGVHHPKTHRVLQLFRTVMDAVAPGRLLLPHEENISYFGDGYNEARLVYNFALPPLVLHSFLTGEVSTLSAWAKGLKTPSDQTAFFNFLASHEGIGVRPVEGILSAAEISNLVETVKLHGGLVSYKTDADGGESPYELNISLFDALNDPQASFPLDLQVTHFMAAQAVMLSLAGVPGIYVHSLLGTRNYREGVQKTGQKRSINRRKFSMRMLELQLDDPNSLRYRVLATFKELLAVRRREAAFHPQASQEILESGYSVFALRRTSLDGAERIGCYHNVSPYPQEIRLRGPATELLTGTPAEAGRYGLEPYGVAWFKESP